MFGFMTNVYDGENPTKSDIPGLIMINYGLKSQGKLSRL
jgi:hypothetical protein